MKRANRILDLIPFRRTWGAADISLSRFQPKLYIARATAEQAWRNWANACVPDIISARLVQSEAKLKHGSNRLYGCYKFDSPRLAGVSVARFARADARASGSKYVFSVAAGILPFSLNISHAAAAGTGRSAPVSGAAMDASEARRGSPLTPGPANVAAAGTAGTAALRIIRCAQRTLNTYPPSGARWGRGNFARVAVVVRNLHGSISCLLRLAGSRTRLTCPSPCRFQPSSGGATSILYCSVVNVER